MTSSTPKPAVRQLRLVVEAEDYDAAVAFYRDALGLTEQAAFEGEGDARVMILNAGIGLNTPPVGTVLFVGCAVGGISIREAMRTIWPFFGASVAVLLLVTYVPALSLWLPAQFH